MMLASPTSPRRQRDDEVGAKLSVDADDVTKQALFVPGREALLDGEGVAEVESAGEELPGPVVAVSGFELSAAQDAEGGAELLADLVLTALPAGQGQKPHFIPESPRQPGDQGAVFVVGMSGDEERAPRLSHASQRELRRLGLTGRRGDPSLSKERRQRLGNEEEKDEAHS